MATYVESLNLLFIHSPHTGSRAVSQVLIDRYQGRRLSTKMHLTSSEALEKIGGSPLKVTTVRDPYDILVTKYCTANFHQLTGKDMGLTFEEYLRSAEPLDFKTLEGIDVFLRYEHLEDDLNTLLPDKVELPRVGETKGKRDYREYYDEETKQLAEKLITGRLNIGEFP